MQINTKQIQSNTDTNEYKAKHLSDAKILAEYYTKTGYYSNIAPAIFADPNFVPTKAAFERMLSNKHAKKILSATKDEAKFAVNDMIQIRGTAGTPYEHWLKELRHRLCFVLSNTAPIVNAVNGAKRYKVLPMG